MKSRAIAFSREHKDTWSESGGSQSFWNEFFEIFGIKRRTVASFEEPVKKLSGTWGKIDLFWPGRVLVEQKSAGQDLDKAHAQGMEYIRGLVDSGREKEVPRWLIVSDFQRIALHDLEPEQDPALPLLKRQPPTLIFPLSDLHKHIRRFAFIPGYKQQKLNPEDPANIEATEIMASLHDALHAGGFSGHDLRVLLVRLLFCLFADDTGIFNQQDFKLFLENHTALDGSDTGPKLARLFDVLNTPEDQRQANLDEDLDAFPYINGALFAERISFADFNTLMRGKLLKACPSSGRASPPPSSAPSSRASWMPPSAARSVLTTPPKKTSSNSSARSSSMNSAPSSMPPVPINPPAASPASRPSTTNSASSPSSTPPAAAATSSSSPTASCASSNSKFY
ncbi:MAG: type IIL restriction-modification enzyme MmeI [Akkermansiaceae bacterium]